MSSEDQFTSIQWDREDVEPQQPAPPVYTPIDEEGEEDAEATASGDSKSGDHKSGSDEASAGKAGGISADEPAAGSDGDDPSNSLLLSKDVRDEDGGAASISSLSSKRRTVEDELDAGLGGLGLGDHGAAVGGAVAAADSSAVAGGSGGDLHQAVGGGASTLHEDAAHYSIVTSVTEAQRETDAAGKPYISYLLTTVTNSPSIARLSKRSTTTTTSAAAANVGASDEGESLVFKIRRRYGDFNFLYDCLCNDYPQLLVPPLPSKSNFKYLTGDTFSTEFVHKRLNSLNRFISFIAQHKNLSQSKIFHLFVSDSSDWSTFQKNLKISRGITDDGPSGAGSGSGGSSNDFPSVVNKVVNEELLTETIMNFLTPSKHKRESNKEILEISDKLKKLYENLIKLDRIFAKLNKKNYDLSFDYEQFSNQITKLSGAAAQQESQAQEVGSTAGADGQKDINGGADDSTAAAHSASGDSIVTNNFKLFASSLSYFSENWSNLHKYIDETFLVALKDCAKYVIQLTNLIELQHNKKIDLQVLQDYLVKTRAELGNLGGASGASGAHNQHHEPPIPVMGVHSSSGGGIVNNTTQLIKDTLSTNSSGSIGSSHTENKKLKLQARIEELESEIQKQSAIVNDLTSRIIHEEYPFWDRFNKSELKSAMLGLCDQQITFYSGLVDKWGEAEIALMNRLKELS